MSSTVLVINSGSSSLKYQLVDPSTGEALASGLAEMIGNPEGHISHKYGDTKTELHEHIADHAQALRTVLDLFNEVGPNLSEAHIVAVGHRIVQGGKYFDGPVIIDDHIRNLIDELADLAPLHNPAHLKGIDVGRKLLADVPHIAVFDTAFFMHLPDEAALYGLDREIAEKYSIRRYGAHGTSHSYVSHEIAKIFDRDDLKQIVLHLGNGASVSAVNCGKAIDTSMGLTPLEGLVMGTRTGDIDPAVVFHLQRVAGMTTAELDDLFNKKSGLKGLTGSNDMRDIREMCESDDPEVVRRARTGLDIYIHRLIRYIGAYTAELGGLDVITFTAGIGERDPDLRKEILERLAPFGITIDENANSKKIKVPTKVSGPDSRIPVWVFPTNEELAIARQAMSLI